MPPASPSRARLQATLAFTAAGFFWWRSSHAGALGLMVLTGIFAVLAWGAPAAYAPVQRSLDRVVALLLKTLSWVVLTLTYFGLFTPLRAYRGLRGVDPLQLTRDASRATYLDPAPPLAPGRFDRQF